MIRHISSSEETTQPTATTGKGRAGRRQPQLLASALTWTLLLSPLATAQPDDEPPANDWNYFLGKLQEVATQSPDMAAEQARLEASRAMYASERGDTGLELSGSYTNYPEGSGAETGGAAGTSGGFTNLEEYQEARLTLDLMDLLARRTSRVDSAEALVEKARYDMKEASTESTITLMEDAVTAWAYQYRREALHEALERVEEAKRKLKLSESASLPEITKATPTSVAEALILHSQVQSDLEAISPFIPTTPDLPPDFSVLPLSAPGEEDIIRVANNDPAARSFQAESIALQEEAESLRGNGVELSIYGGYVVQSVRDTSGTEEGPQFGARLTIPLGSSQHHERAAREYESHAAKMDAQAALHQRQRDLLDLRDSWAQSVAQLNDAQENMRQQAKLLENMNQRAAAPRAGQAPEPWEVDMQAARFWNAVATVWEQRAAWIQNVLTWGLMEPEYLQARARPANPQAASSLCAPLESCGVTGN